MTCQFSLVLFYDVFLCCFKIGNPYVQGNLKIGSVREVNESLEILDDEERVFSVRIVRVKNYTSTMTIHSEMVDGRPGTLVVESYVVDVPDGKSKEEICCYVEGMIKCKLKSLADASESLVVKRPR